MKFGVADYGINVWDGGLYNLESRLLDLKGLGFDGIERLEAVSESNALMKAAQFHKLGMDFGTCRGPNVEVSNQWTCGLGKKYVWINAGVGTREVDMDTYLRRCRKFTKEANTFGLDAVLHNHLGSRIQFQEEVDTFMKECPKAKLLLDIGHLFGAGGDIVGTIEKYKNRLAPAFHFKDIEMKDESIGLDDWSKRLRFCELGAGNVGLDYKGVINALKKIGYDDWIFIEHDTHMDEPVKELKISLDILKDGFNK